MAAKAQYFGPGGSAANTATWLTHHTSQLALLSGVIGTDAAGQALTDGLQACGVDMSYVSYEKDYSTPHALCLVSSTDKRIVTAPKALHVHFNHVLLPQAEETKHIHFSGGNMLLMEKYEERTRFWSCTRSVDIAQSTSSRVLSVADLAFCNADDLQRITGIPDVAFSCTDKQRLLPRKGSLLVVTCGAKEVRTYSDTQVSSFQVDALNTQEIIDRTGAGDAFNAGFLAAWLTGASLEKSVSKGIMLAKQALTQIGGIACGSLRRGVTTRS